MFFQQDTVLRMIEQLGYAYRELMRLLDDLEARHSLEKQYKRLCGMDMETAKGLSCNSLTELLPEDRRMVLSELIAMETERFQHKLEAEDVLAGYQKSLLLLCTIEDATIAEMRAARARGLFDLCANALSTEDTAAVLRFLLAGGAYADAEDVFFLQLHSFYEETDLAALLPIGADLYARLESRTDSELRQGNLPRDEVQAGRAALESWAARRFTLISKERNT